MRHTHDICLIHEADAAVLQVQLGESFLGEIQIVVEALMARGQWIPHDTYDERAVHKRHLTVERFDTSTLLNRCLFLLVFDADDGPFVIETELFRLSTL